MIKEKLANMEIISHLPHLLATDQTFRVEALGLNDIFELTIFDKEEATQLVKPDMPSRVIELKATIPVISVILKARSSFSVVSEAVQVIIRTFDTVKLDEALADLAVPEPARALLPGILLGVELACAQLSNHELIALDLVMQADQDPSRLPAYPKVKDLLFTLDGGKRMHRDAKYALHQVTLSRLPKLA